MSTFADQIARVVANLTAEECISMEEALRLAYRVGRRDGAADLTPRRATAGPATFCSDRDAARAILAGEDTDQDVSGAGGLNARDTLGGARGDSARRRR